MNKQQNQIRIMIIVVCAIVLLSSGSSITLFSFESLGYPSGYQGVNTSFSGLDYTAGSYSDQVPLSSLSFFFDPDDPNKGECNLAGEMTNAFVPQGPRPASWVYPEWWDTATGYITNPMNTYTWNLPNPNQPDEIIAYEMQEWMLKFYVTITAEWDEISLGFHETHDAEWHTKRYQDTQIWIKLSMSPTWYFEGSDSVYFAIGKVRCSDRAYGKLGTTDEDYEPSPLISVAPQSGGSRRYLYYQNFGKAGQMTNDPASYQGRVLNPDLFVNEVYIKLDLNSFGTWHKSEWWGTEKKGDAVTWGFDIHVFVVGEWVVQDIDELPGDYGRTGWQETDKYGWVELLEDPRFIGASFIGIIALIFLVLAIVAPSVLFGLFGLLSMRRSKT